MRSEVFLKLQHAVESDDGSTLFPRWLLPKLPRLDRGDLDDGDPYVVVRMPTRSN
jgi:hypothetical protein